MRNQKKNGNRTLKEKIHLQKKHDYSENPEILGS
jgi:hypothetical protein